VPTTIVYSAAAARDLAHFDPQVARRIVAAVGRYAETGGGNIRRLTAAGGAFRLRVGDWRVRFYERIGQQPGASLTATPETVRVIEVVRVRHRSVAYRDP